MFFVHILKQNYNNNDNNFGVSRCCGITQLQKLDKPVQSLYYKYLSYNYNNNYYYFIITP